MRVGYLKGGLNEFKVTLRTFKGFRDFKGFEWLQLDFNWFSIGLKAY